MMNLDAAPTKANPSTHPNLSRSDEFSLSHGIPSAANSAQDRSKIAESPLSRFPSSVMSIAPVARGGLSLSLRGSGYGSFKHRDTTIKLP
ncbi:MULTISPECIES: hypothetical protein [unclassified Bradyrhizobium]|uniref:hypothetical protein n=1 Tax=unclassified Bradyrhizobium TaxID=2631580 RepID=UPI00244CCC40|nr:MULTISPECIES: hypothetical protein [unclassified Bradyrhizobium]MDH2347613.1 hypothetical protein [Bradyrhizobium sp. SSUT77]MDH2349244.1 hypothetical protein [Bradyrhizobium sp. SSUT112]